MRWSERAKNGHENSQERWTIRDVGHLGTFESEHSNALERLVENVHVHASKMKDQL